MRLKALENIEIHAMKIEFENNQNDFKSTKRGRKQIFKRKQFYDGLRVFR